ncbi:MAG: hypothetical protein ACOY3P_21335, partial [Planctomycetota bacterium]
LPVAALRLPLETLDLLRQLGIDRVGQLADLPREELPARLGTEPLRRLDQLAGFAPEPIRAMETPDDLDVDWPLEYPTRNRETVEAVLERLMQQLAAKLRQQGRGAIRLVCRLSCPPDTDVAISVGFFEPSGSAQHLFQLVRMQFDRLRLPAAVTAVRVQVTLAAPIERRQQTLFVDERRSLPHQLAALLDRLSTRLGRQAVAGVHLQADAQPELAWHYDPLVGQPRRRRGRGSLPQADDLRPLRLLVRPAPLAATAVLPEGPPVQFRWENNHHRIDHAWGPERIETGWWRGRMVGRDYYRVETTSGQRFWLFRRLRDGRWFLHGVFE